MKQNNRNNARKTIYLILYLALSSKCLFPLRPHVLLQNIYIKEQFLAFTLLYSYSILKLGEKLQIRFNKFQMRLKLRLTTPVKASNIFHLECKTKS